MPTQNHYYSFATFEGAPWSYTGSIQRQVKTKKIQFTLRCCLNSKFPIQNNATTLPISSLSWCINAWQAPYHRLIETMRKFKKNINQTDLLELLEQLEQLEQATSELKMISTLGSMELNLGNTTSISKTDVPTWVQSSIDSLVTFDNWAIPAGEKMTHKPKRRSYALR